MPASWESSLPALIAALRRLARAQRVYLVLSDAGWSLL